MNVQHLEKLKNMYPSANKRRVELPWPLVKTAFQISVLILAFIIGIFIFS